MWLAPSTSRGCPLTNPGPPFKIFRPCGQVWPLKPRLQLATAVSPQSVLSTMAGSTRCLVQGLVRGLSHTWSAIVWLSKVELMPDAHVQLEVA